MLLTTIMGAVLGGLGGGIAATGGLGLVIVGSVGLTFSSLQAIGAYIEAQTEGWNPCTVTDLVMGITGAALSALAIYKGAQIRSGTS